MLRTKTGGRDALRDGPLAAARNILIGIGLLRVFDLHVPPALAVALLPFVIAHPINQLSPAGRRRDASAHYDFPELARDAEVAAKARRIVAVRLSTRFSRNCYRFVRFHV